MRESVGGGATFAAFALALAAAFQSFLTPHFFSFEDVGVAPSPRVSLFLLPFCLENGEFLDGCGCHVAHVARLVVIVIRPTVQAELKAMF